MELLLPQTLLLQLKPRGSRSSSTRVSPSFSILLVHHLHSPFLGFHLKKPTTHSSRCYATNPEPPESESNFGKDLVPVLGPESTMSKFQDRAQIFIAVLFWMSLFFWACASDGRNDGKPTKGSGFRR